MFTYQSYNRDSTDATNMAVESLEGFVTSKSSNSSKSSPPAPELIRRVALGDRDAYNTLVESYTPLVWSVCISAGLGSTDSEDVVQGVWLRVVQHLAALREPEKFPGWLATIARNECVAVIRRTIRARSTVAASASDLATDKAYGASADKTLLENERSQAVRSALANLDVRCRELLSMLHASPPVSYADIGQSLSIPVASIGPTRSRCLDKLRRSPSIVSIAEH
jgi:RNA polymerase sigma factor (sigma-70 family)